MVRRHIGKMPERREDSHKGDYGRVLVVAGSRGLTGAAFLCSQAALVSGSGLVTNAIPESRNVVIETKLTEVMTLPVQETKDGTISKKAGKQLLEFSKKCDVVAIGPGLGTNDETMSLAKGLIQKVKCPVVIDADALNAIDPKFSLLKKRKNSTVITPHPGELSRIIKKDVPFIQMNRTQITKKLAKTSDTVVCLKGHKTVVANKEGRTYVNTTGNSGMATGGCGDVLTGIIASFIGQGIDAYSATVSAVYLHGLAGDLALDKKGPFSLIASDLLDFLPQAFDKAGIF